MSAKVGENDVEVHPDSTTHLDLVRDIADRLQAQDNEDPFCLLDIGEIVARMEEWRTQLPRVKPFYAVKCNDDPVLLRVLTQLGTGFDCASKKEIDDVLGTGAGPERIVYAHACKHSTYIRHAARVNVHLMTFDNEEELRKIKADCPQAKLLIRLLPPTEGFEVLHELGNKFGCHPLDARGLLETAMGLGLKVVGVHFHVGCGVKDFAAYAAAVESAASVFDVAKELGLDFNILDIGGGFPSSFNVFRQIASVFRGALDEHFPESRGVTLMAEPGRYVPEVAMTATVRVLGKRRASQHVTRTGAQHNAALILKGQENVVSGSDAADKCETFAYFTNDGVYGSFNCVLTDIVRPPVYTRLVKPPREKEEFVSTVYGPTCDGMDQILADVSLPELHLGDVLNFPNMGAYTTCIYSAFNGMPRPLVFYHCAQTVWGKLFPSQDLPSSDKS